jgi:hypothetical protein
LNVIDDRAARSEPLGDLARERALVFARHGAPEHDFAATDDDADPRCVHFTMALHLFLDAIAQLGVGWGNLAHSRATMGGVHDENRLQTTCLVGARANSSAHAPIRCAVLLLWRDDYVSALAPRLQYSERRRSCGTHVATTRAMDQALSRLLTVCALVVSAGVLSVTACTRTTTDRVVEPVSGPDGSTPTPEVADAGTAPIGPIAHPIEPPDDFRLVRAPELGMARETPRLSLSAEQEAGGSNPGGGAGSGGSDLRPVACGGLSYY